MGGAINNMENLVKQPSGCGEQNMINFAPAIFTTLYLEQKGQLSASFRKKAYKFYNSGYQNQLKWVKNLRISTFLTFIKNWQNFCIFITFLTATNEKMVHSVLLAKEMNSEAYGLPRLF